MGVVHHVQAGDTMTTNIKPGDRIIVGGEERVVLKVESGIVEYHDPTLMERFIFETRVGYALWSAWGWVKWKLRGSP